MECQAHCSNEKVVEETTHQFVYLWGRTPGHSDGDEGETRALAGTDDGRQAGTPAPVYAPETADEAR